MKNSSKFNRRDFMGLGAGAIAGGLLGAQSGQAHAEQIRRGLDFVNAPTGNGPYSVHRNGPPPNIFLITMDMVSPDLYSPGRPYSRRVHLPAINSLMRDGLFSPTHFARFPFVLLRGRPISRAVIATLSATGNARPTDS